ncbi:hypothetical protein SAMN05518671_2618 [Stenotrophomonas lactitubi]|nr:hypothetical protein SAMN04487863_1294 [Stenotrophomonas sp. yr243]SNT51163.1 hypothetical protein SAMN05518671_2618 [Stenotrophomonas lactitubi]
MPTGLQCWDEYGDISVDLTSRMTRLLGGVNQSGGGSLQEPALSQGVPFVLPILDQNGLMYPADITVPTISGTTVSWTTPANFYFGTY